MTSQVTLTRFSFLFLGDLYCSESEVNRVANINWLQHINNEGQITQWAVHVEREREVSGSNPGVVKYFPPACPSRAMFPTLVGLRLKIVIELREYF